MSSFKSSLGLLLSGLVVVAVTGCAAEANDGSLTDNGELVAFPQPSREQAVAAFLANPVIQSELGDHKHSAPEALIYSRGEGGEVAEYLVATWYDATPDGVFDASWSREVAARVRIRFGAPPAVIHVDVNSSGDGRVSTVAAKASKEAAVQAFLADSVVKEAFGSHAPGQPEAVQISFGTSFGEGASGYLVVGHYLTPSGGEDLPPGLPVGGLTLIDHRVSAIVFFPPFGGSPSVASARITEAEHE
jgi:hypothetical protein